MDINGYTIDGNTHSGRQGSVLLATRDSDSLPVLIKVASIADSISRKTVLEHEFEILRSLPIDCVPVAVEFIRTSDHHLLVLERFDGLPLDSFLLGTQFDVSDFFPIAIQLADILSRLHAGDVIHKNIKPSNVLIHRATGALQLIDFGISVRADLGQDATPVTVLEGSLPYIAPEQTGRIDQIVDRRSDLYSLGASFYEMLTGRLPFEAIDPLELIHAHIAKKPRPPNEIRPDLPVALSNIVLKLLAKHSRERYQSADGLRADLVRCRDLGATNLTIDFKLGQSERPDRLAMPDSLYGRDAERTILEGCLERARNGNDELVLIRGNVGEGKTALAGSLEQHVLECGGYFARGQFESDPSGVPYFAIATALTSIVRQFLTLSDMDLDAWRSRVGHALGPNGQLAIDLVPSLEFVLGPQDAVPDVPPVEAAYRFRRTIRRLVGALASPEHPLVIVLDDLQFADAASLQLIKSLLTRDGEVSSEPRALLIVCTCSNRDEDVSHPTDLSSMLDEFDSAGIAYRSLELSGLTDDDVLAFVSDVLGRQAAISDDELTRDTRRLAAWIAQRSGGNPLLLRELLLFLAGRELIHWAPEMGWSWDPTAVEATDLPDGIGHALRSRVDELPEQSRRLLAYAA